MNEIPTNLIYGLVDPRTLLIRYVGMSSTGIKRPKNHRMPSCPDTYCRRWVKALKRQGLDYEIAVLEVLKGASELAQAERWWIAFGKACGWPLTNLTDGRGPSEVAVAERREAVAQRALAATLANRIIYSPEEVAEFERLRKLRDAPSRDPKEIRATCFDLFAKLFAKHDGQRSLLIDVVIEARVTPNTAERLYAEWLKCRRVIKRVG